MRRTLLLINPVDKSRPGFWMNRGTIYPPLAFGIIKSLTPQNWNVEIIDENFENFSFRKADLVGITSYTSSINRAYSIAQEY
ncbi:MAG: hypothetical protein Kow0068_26200 [Marinilabiliales bacterium]